MSVYLNTDYLIIGGAESESQNYTGLHRMQTAKLQHHEKQKE